MLIQSSVTVAGTPLAVQGDAGAAPEHRQPGLRARLRCDTSADRR